MLNTGKIMKIAKRALALACSTLCSLFRCPLARRSPLHTNRLLTLLVCLALVLVPAFPVLAGYFGPRVFFDASSDNFIDEGAHSVDAGGSEIVVRGDGTHTYTLAGTIADPQNRGGGHLIKSGSGTLVFDKDNNTYTGATMVTGGILRIKDSNSINPDAVGNAVSGFGSRLESMSDLVIGDTGTGSLRITDGGRAEAQNIFLGYSAGAGGTATVSGPSSTLAATGNLVIGNTGSGDLRITDGGQATAQSIILGNDQGSGGGSVTVSGETSELRAAQQILVGNEGAGLLAGTGTVVANNQGTPSSVFVNATGVLSAGDTPGSTGTLSFGTAAESTDLMFEDGAVLRVDAGGTGVDLIRVAGTAAMTIGNKTMIIDLTSLNTVTGAAILTADTLDAGNLGKVTFTLNGIRLDEIKHDNNRLTTAAATVAKDGNTLKLTTDFSGAQNAKMAWTGASDNQWDMTGMNWQGVDNSSLTQFLPGDWVVFETNDPNPVTVTAPQPITVAQMDVTDGTWTIKGNITARKDAWVGDPPADAGSLQGSLRISGSGTEVFLSGNNAFHGGISIDEGSLTLQSQTAAGHTGIAMRNNGQLALDFSGTLANDVSGKGSLYKNGVHTTILSGANTYTGETGINAGTLMAGRANAFSAASVHNLSGTAILDLGGFDQTIAGLVSADSASRVRLATGTLTLNVADNASYTYAGYINGAGGLIKTGPGTQELSKTAPSGSVGNDYIGATVVTGGTLRIANYDTINPDSPDNAVSGSGSVLQSDQQLIIGKDKVGGLRVTEGGEASAKKTITLGYSVRNLGTITVSGQSSTLASEDGVDVGYSGGSGVLQITQGGKVSAAKSITVGSGVLQITQGGKVSAAKSITVGSGTDISNDGSDTVNSFGTATVNGPSSTLTSQETIIVGGNDTGVGVLHVTEGGKASGKQVELAIGTGGYGMASVRGASSSLAATAGNIIVGKSGTGILHISAGGKVSATGEITLSPNSNQRSAVMVNGANSSLSTGGALTVGLTGSGVLTISDGGKVSVNTVLVGPNSGSSGTITVRGETSELRAKASMKVGDTDNDTGVGLLAGTGVVVVNDSGSAGTVSVTSKGALSAGDTPGAIGTLTIGSATEKTDLEFESGATLRVDTNSDNEADFIKVHGTATMGTSITFDLTSLNTVSNVPILTADTLTADGLTPTVSLSGVPLATVMDENDRIDSQSTASVSKDDNSLILTTNFYDTQSAKMAWTNADTPGEWDMITANWKGVDAETLTKFLPGDWVSFNTSGTGSVTAPQPVTVSQMDVTDGTWTIKGDITARKDAWVGDPLTTDAGGLQGSLRISGPDTSVTLNGNNSFAGGISIDKGLLVLASMTAAGEAPIGLQNDGALELGFSGTFANNVSGSGRLNLVSSHTVLLSGSHDFSGAVHIHGKSTLIAGSATALSPKASYLFEDRAVLDLGDFDQTIGGLSSDKASAGVHLGTATLTVDVSTGASDFAGTITGTGGLTKTGEGRLALTGVNTYSGLTTVNKGTLQLGNDGITGSIVGDVSVAENAALNFSRSDILTYAGLISGEGSLEKDSTGTLILTGDNTYTGGTTISGGTLQIGNGGDTGSITGNIENNSKFVFNRSDDVTYSDTMSGNGSVTQAGSGNLILTEANTYTGGTTIPDGRLTAENKAALGTGDVTTGDNGILVLDFEGEFENIIKGTGNVEIAGEGVSIKNSTNITANVTGTLVGTSSVYKSINVIGGGTISPGGQDAFGTITTTENLTFEPGSIYKVEVEPGGTGSDLLVVTGTAILNNGTVHHIGFLENGGKYSPMGEWTILEAGTLVGKFENVKAAYNFLNASLLYGAKDVKLRLERNDVNFASKGKTPNQKATASGIESQGTGNEPYDYVVKQLNTADMGAIYDGFSGEMHAGFQSEIMQQDRKFANSQKKRLSGNTSSIGVSTGAFGEKADFWFSIDGYKSTVDRTSNTSKSELKGWGASFGLEKEVYDWTLGAAFRYGDSEYKVKNLYSKADLDSFNFGLYAGRPVGDFNVKFGVGYGFHQVDSRRHLSFMGENLKSDYDIHSYQLFGEVGYLKDFGAFSMEPYAGLAWNYAENESFTEKGGASGLHAKSESSDNATSSLGVRGHYKPAEKVKINADLNWQHLFGDKESQGRFAFTGGNYFTIEGAPQDRDSLGLGLDMDVELQENLSIRAGYVGRFGEDTDSHAGFVNLEFTF